MRLLRNIFLLFSTLRLIPHWVIFNIHKKKSIIAYDVKRWLELYRLEEQYGSQSGFLYLMTFFEEYRNLFYYRIRDSKIYPTVFM